MSGTKAPSSPSPSIIEAAVRLCWSESPCLPSSPLLSPAFLEKKQNKTKHKNLSFPSLISPLWEPSNNRLSPTQNDLVASGWPRLTSSVS